MKFFHRNKHQRIFEYTITLAVLLSVIVTLSVPRTVEANVSEAFDIAVGALFGDNMPDFPISEDSEPLKTRRFLASAYSSDRYQTDGSPFTPSDMSNYRDMFRESGAVYAIAANDLPLGTRVRIPKLYGDQIFVVRDRMNARYTGRSRLDVYMAVGNEDGTDIDLNASRAAAKQFGLKNVEVEIYPR